MDDIPLPANKTMFDQQPIGNSTKMMLQQYPADFDPSKIEAKPQPLPLVKRLASKVWKVKKQALQQLLKIVSSQNHQEFTQHESTIIKLLADSNVQCQIISAKILFQYLQKEQSYSGQVKPILKNVIEKLMTIQKQDIQNLALQILYWLMDHGFQQLLMIQLNQYLLNKNPKIMAASLKSIQSLINNYGIKKLKGLEIFTKNLKIMADVARPMAKPQTIQLFKEIFKWMGEQLFLSFVLHAQVKEQVVKWTKTYQMQPMEIKRGLKKGQQGKKINPMQQQQQCDNPVDILHHFDSRWVDTVLQIQKWQQKKQHLEQFIKKTRVGAIVPRQTSHYITLIKRLCSQNNINLLQCGFKIVKNLCKGLKKAFATSCKSFLSYVYLKLKDNKAMIVDQTLATLKAMTYSITLQDMQEQIKLGLKDKSPQMRLNTLKLLKDITAKKQPKTTKILKSLLQTLIGLTNDSASEVRDIALNVLCKIKEHYGMIFFQDKLESMPAKKVNQIRSTPTIGCEQENQCSKMEIEEVGMNFMRSNVSMSQTSIRGGSKQIKENKAIANKKKPLQVNIENQTVNNNKISNNKLADPMIEKKSSIISQNMEKKPSILQMSIIRQQPHVFRVERSEEDEIIALRNEQWPIVPTSWHVLRLITLFTKLGEPFVTLATPFKLKLEHLEILENSNTDLIIANADLLLKWVLWRIQIQNNNIVEKLLSVIIHIMYLLKNNISSDQTVLILSNLSSLLQSDFWNNEMLKYINSDLVKISIELRQKVFNFWISTLNSSSSDPQYCERILSLLKSTFRGEGFTCEQICTMARTQAIVKNKRFVGFLFDTHRSQLLKVSGFTLEQSSKTSQQWVLKQSETQFSTEMSLLQRNSYFQVFKRNSQQAIEEIKKLQESCPKRQIMALHIKLMETIMIPYLTQKLQSINVYNYFKLLTSRITVMCQPRNNEIQYITPHLRNLMRLTIFFLIDLSESRLDNKDELTRAVNKIILVFLQKMPAQHLLQVMTMLLKYAIKNNLIKRLSQLLMKCIIKTTHSQSFVYKTQKNIKLLFNFFVQLIEQNSINDDQHLFRMIKTLFNDLMAGYKELCSQIVIEKLNQFGPKGFKCKQIQSIFKNFIGFINRNDDEPRNIVQKSNDYSSLNSMKIDSKIAQNYQQMSNLPQIPSKFVQNYQNVFNNPQQIQKNMKLKSQNSNSKIQTNKMILQQQNIDLSTNSDISAKILQERKRLQNYQGLYQSWQGLVKMKQEISNKNITTQNQAINPNQQMNI